MIKLALLIIGFLIFMVGMAGCGESPEQVKKWNDLKSACESECKSNGVSMYEFGTSLSGKCRCTQ